MIRLWCWALAGLAGWSVSCAPKPKDLIVGKWEGIPPAGRGMALEFTKEGEVRATLRRGPATGKYRFVAANTVDVDAVDAQGNPLPGLRFRVQIEGDVMTTTEEVSGEVYKFTRVR